jgi:hypothetical protein
MHFCFHARFLVYEYLVLPHDNFGELKYVESNM